MNLRSKYVSEYLDICQRFRHLLNDWEVSFVENVKTIHPDKLTSNQYNRLKEIAEKVCEEVA